jgi:GGDEF domain-containing protein
MSISIGVLHLPATGHGITDPAELAEKASHAKHEAKKYRGFSLVCESVGPEDAIVTPSLVQ